MTLEDFQSQLLGHEQLLEHQATTTEHTFFAMFSQRSPANPKYNNNFKRKFSPSNPSSSNKNFPQKKPYHFPISSSQGTSYSEPPNNFTRAPSSNPSPSNRIPCQICDRVNHQVLDCFHQMDYAFQRYHPPANLASMVAQANSVEDKITG
jgi:hypothetical protein